jgi:hypothetical protein
MIHGVVFDVYFLFITGLKKLVGSIWNFRQLMGEHTSPPCVGKEMQWMLYIPPR